VVGDLALTLSGISRRFESTRALDNLELGIRRGEVHGLLGENGSGKSTLVKILAGYHAPEPGGEAWAWGARMQLPVTDADGVGIAVVHQDLGLVETMTVIENLGVSVAYGRRLLGSISWGEERRTARRLLAELGVELDPERLVGDLTLAERALVAVARARRQIELRGRDRVLFILDEPTVSLPEKQAGEVLDLMRSLAGKGDAVLFISHRLQEVLAVADRITVIRDGRAVATLAAETADEAHLAQLMLGRRLDAFYPDRLPPERETVMLETEKLSGGIVQELSIRVVAGEIVGFTGLAGEGHEQLANLIVGILPRRTGQVRVLGGAPLRPGPRAALRAGIALVPADRRQDGIWPAALAWENISLPVLTRRRRWLAPVRPTREVASAERSMRQFLVKPPRPRLPTSAFSGGNQQKIVLAKWLQGQPRVLLLDEPTQGVDAGARREILEIVSEAAAKGAAVLVFSSDLEQLSNMCHRVLVLRRGKVAAEHAGEDLDEAALARSCWSWSDE
jgi:ribose transport system ATP-binding protein